MAMTAAATAPGVQERCLGAVPVDGVPVLEAVGLHRFFRNGDEEVAALRDVSLCVGGGELVTVVGPSGSGKSTLLTCLAGLDDPDGGRVRVNGTTISHVPERERARIRSRLVGVVGAGTNLFEHLTVLDNVKVAARLSGLPAVTPRARGALADVGLELRRHAYPSRLSGGELVRAALAVALVNDPPLLIADEPTGELDAETEQVVLRLLRSGTDAGHAVVVAGHSVAVTDGADRVLTLRDGRPV